ncbi:MAG: hypothetical protein ACOCUA_02335 [archaeon]
MSHRDPDLDRKIARGLIVQEYGPDDDVGLLEYLADRSRADPFEIDADGGETR